MLKTELKLYFTAIHAQITGNGFRTGYARNVATFNSHQSAYILCNLLVCLMPGGGGVTTICEGTGCAILWGAFFPAKNKFWGIIFGKITSSHKFWGVFLEN